MSEQVNVLLSFAYHAKVDLAEVREAIGRDALLLIDSGAYSAWNIGKSISLDSYATYLRRWEGVYDAAITLDVIGDHVATATNTAELHRRGLPVMPVQTTGGSLDDFDRLCTDRDYVAVGGIAGMTQQASLRERYTLMLIRRAARSGARLHLLGVSGPRMLRSGCYSADTCGYVNSMFRHGNIWVWNPRTGRADQFRLREHDQLRAHQTELTGLGVDVKRLCESRRLNFSVKSGVAPQLIRASMWSIYVSACTSRADPVAPPRGMHLPGPRMVFAFGSLEKDWRPALDMARQARDGDYPPTVARALRHRQGAPV